MAHEWHRGVLTASSWHGLENVDTLDGPTEMIAKGEACCAWPVEIGSEAMYTSSNLKANCTAIVGTYADTTRRVLGVNGDRYRVTTSREWRDLVKATCAAGAKPTGAFALREGSRVLATFDVGGNGIRTQLLLADSFDGSLRVTCGFTSIRVVCANTLAMAFSSDGEEFAQIRHTQSAEEKINRLTQNIGSAIKAGQKIKDMFERAEQTVLTPNAARKAFDLLFPEADKDASLAAQTRAENIRSDARRAAQNVVNRVGDRAGNLATLWNAATYLVDRQADGSPRDARGGADKLDSLLFGKRSERIQEIQTLIEVIMADGSIRTMNQHEAMSEGVEPRQVARQVLKDLGL